MIIFKPIIILKLDFFLPEWVLHVEGVFVVQHLDELGMSLLELSIVQNQQNIVSCDQSQHQQDHGESPHQHFWYIKLNIKTIPMYSFFINAYILINFWSMKEAVESSSQRSLSEGYNNLIIGYYPIRGKAQVPRLLCEYLSV